MHVPCTARHGTGRTRMRTETRDRRKARLLTYGQKHARQEHGTETRHEHGTETHATAPTAHSHSQGTDNYLLGGAGPGGTAELGRAGLLTYWCADGPGSAAGPRWGGGGGGGGGGDSGYTVQLHAVPAGVSRRNPRRQATQQQRQVLSERAQKRP
jgi:hypothetical protein